MRTKELLAGISFLLLLPLFSGSSFAAEVDADKQPIAITEIKRDKPVDFMTEVLPVFKKSCLACHNASDAKGELTLETPTSILKGGETGPAVVPGKGAESLLLQVASRQVKPFMPPRNNKAGAPPLSSEELGLLKLWVDQGATGTVSMALGPVNWQPLPPGLKGVTAVALTTDGQYVACSRGNQIFIYNLASGQLETRLTDPELLKNGFAKGPGIADRDIIQSLAFSPDNRTLASGAYRSVKLWEKVTRHPSAQFPFAAAGEIRALAASPDGKFILTGGADAIVKLWEVSAAKIVSEFRGHTGPITSVALTSDGSKIAASSTDKTILVWNVSEPSLFQKFELPSEILAVVWAPSGQQLISASADGPVRIWKLSEAAPQAMSDIPAIVAKAEVSPDGKILAAAAPDGEVRLIDVATGKSRLTVTNGSPVVAMHFWNSMILTLTEDKALRLYNESGAKVAETILPAKPTALAVDVKNTRVAFTSGETDIQIADLSNNSFKLGTLIKSELKNISSLAMNPEGTLLFVSNPEVKISAYKIADGSKAFDIANGAPVRGISVSHDGKILAAGSEDNQVRLWNAENGSPHAKASLGGFGAPVKEVRLSADGKYVLAMSTSAQILLFDLASGVVLQAFNDPNGLVHSIAFVGEKRILSFASLNSIRIADLLVEKILPGHSQAVTSLALYPGSQLISGSKDGSVRHWNLENGQQLRQMDHGGEITSIAVSKDGKRIASTGVNKILKLWNGENGQLVTEIKGGREAKQSLAQLERDLAFAKTEVTHHKAVVENSEKQEKLEGEAAKKAADAKDKAEKNYAEKLDAHKKAAEAKSAADKILAELNAGIKSAREKKPELEKQHKETAEMAKQLTEKLSQAKATAEKAAQDKTSIYKALLDSAFQAKLASYQAAEAKASADKEPGNAALVEAKNNAEKVALEKSSTAETLIDKLSVAKPAYDKAQSEFQAADKTASEAVEKAKAAEALYTANEKILADADKNSKENEEKVKNADKALADATQALKTAEGAKNGGVQSLESTIAGQKKAADAVAQARKDKEQADQFVSKSEQLLEAAKKQIPDAEKPFVSVAFSANDSILGVGSEDGVISLFTADAGKFYDKIPAHSSKINAVAFTQNNQLASGGADHSLKVWPAAPSWQLVRTFGNGEENSPFIDRVLALDFSPDGRFLATGGGFPSRSGEIQIWNIVEGNLVGAFKDPHSDTVYSVQFSPDQKYVASGGADKFLRVFELASHKQFRTFEGHTHHVLGVAWQRHGRTLASAGADKVVKIWDFASGEQRKTIEGFGKEVTSIRFIDGSNEALVSCGDNQVKLIRDDGGNVRNFGGSADFTSAAAITPDGSLVAAGGLDGVLRVWNGSKGELIKAFESPKPEEPSQIAGK